jgi:formylglycine-generating enzyme required for sulfatase activity
MKHLVLSAVAVSVILLSTLANFGQEQNQAKEENAPEFTNSIGIKMVRIPAGKFRMGDLQPPTQYKPSEFMAREHYDERPGHEVTVSDPFYISETEITARQFQEFRMSYEDEGHFSPSASGMSWYDAVRFTRWLSRREHRNYRLPTEAEWEYACRAGTTTPFSSGDQPPQSGQANAWGLKNMETGVPEWVLDWYGPYPESPQTDPVGPRDGFSKVVRGGGFMAARRGRQEDDTMVPAYRRCANRASVAPGYHGREIIGFRIVMAPMPYTKPWPEHRPFIRRFIKGTGSVPVAARPDPSKPWFRQRDMLPIPPENASTLEIEAAGFGGGVHDHNHSPGLAVMPNGDVLAIFFSSSAAGSEYAPSTSFVATRLRFGSNQWDPPELFYDFADVNDQSALLWTEGNQVNFFGGGIGLPGVPFRWTWSTDSGATWSPIKLPVILGSVGGYSPQPITSAFRGPHGTLYVATDAIGGESNLWASHDEGRTWQDTGGRTGGRHTAFVMLKDGCILGMGGKSTNIDGYMPESISCDGGRTWTIRKSPFAALGSNQRPTIIRLADGKLFFASDYQDRKERAPAGAKQRGAFVALSSDEGQAWRIKRLATALQHEAHVVPPRGQWHERDYGGDATLGYTVATQAPNGLIYLISTMNHPAQEFEMNEAWILSDDSGRTPMTNGPGRILQGRETYPDGSIKATWSGKFEPDGRYELDGTGRWYYRNGKKAYEVTYKDGNKTGLETYWAPKGHVVWVWDHRADNQSVWTHYWPNGNKKQQSEWYGEVANGPAVLWDRSGRVIGRYQFKDGVIIK